MKPITWARGKDELAKRVPYTSNTWKDALTDGKLHLSLERDQVALFFDVNKQLVCAPLSGNHTITTEKGKGFERFFSDDRGIIMFVYRGDFQIPWGVSGVQFEAESGGMFSLNANGFINCTVHKTVDFVDKMVGFNLSNVFLVEDFRRKADALIHPVIRDEIASAGSDSLARIHQKHLSLGQLLHAPVNNILNSSFGVSLVGDAAEGRGFTITSFRLPPVLQEILERFTAKRFEERGTKQDEHKQKENVQQIQRMIGQLRKLDPKSKAVVKYINQLKKIVSSNSYGASNTAMVELEDLKQKLALDLQAAQVAADKAATDARPTNMGPEIDFGDDAEPTEEAKKAATPDPGVKQRNGLGSTEMIIMGVILATIAFAGGSLWTYLRKWHTPAAKDLRNWIKITKRKYPSWKPGKPVPKAAQDELAQLVKGLDTRDQYLLRKVLKRLQVKEAAFQLDIIAAQLERRGEYLAALQVDELAATLLSA